MVNEKYENTTPNVNVWDMDDHYGNVLKHNDISSHNIVNLVKGIYDSTVGKFMDTIITYASKNKNEHTQYYPLPNLIPGHSINPPQFGGRKIKKRRTKRKKYKKKDKPKSTRRSR